MALVLVRELNGKGNYDSAEGRLRPSVPVTEPNGRKRMLRTGGDAFQPEFGKGSLLVFKPWEAVVCPSGRAQEDAVLGYVGNLWPADPPIKRLDFTGRENRPVMLEYLRRHPEIAPKAAPGTAEYTLEMMALIDHFTATDVPQGRSKVIPMRFDATPAELEAQAQALKAREAPTPTRQFGTEGGEASIAKGQAAEAGIAAKAAAETLYEQKYTEHRAAGASEKQAALWANRSRLAAQKESAPPPSVQATTG